jgi:hypothetical protein
MGVSVATPGTLSGVSAIQTQRIRNTGVSGSQPALNVVGSSGSYTQYGGGVPNTQTSSPINTYDPQQAGTNTSGTLGATDSYGGYTGDGGGYVDPAISAEAERQAKLAEGRAAVTNLVGSITGVYDALYGDIGTVAREKTGQLESKYGREIENYTGEFNDQFPVIGQSYAARGAYDSSYRQDKEGIATRGFQRGLGDIQANKREDLAKVGQYISQTQADINAQKGGTQAILDQLAAIEDENTLTNLRNELDTKLRTLQASRAGNQSQAAYMNTLNTTVPGASRMGSIKANLDNVLKSAIPTALKRSVVTQLVNNAGLASEDAQKLLGELNLQLSQEEKQAQAV